MDIKNATQTIEKFDFSRDHSGFTTFFNEVINLICEKDCAAAGLYCYLLARPPTWEVKPIHLMKAVNCGKYKLLDILIDLKLITRKESRDAGRFSSYHYQIHLYPKGFSPYPDLPDTEKPDTVNQDTYKIKSLEKKEDTTTSSSSIFEQYKTQELRQLQSASDAIDKDKKILGFKQEALNDEKCITIFTERFAGFEITLEELYDECCAYWSQKNQLVYKQRFYTHLSKAPLRNYSQKKISKSEFQVPTAEFERIQNEAGERKRKERYEKFLQNQKV